MFRSGATVGVTDKTAGFMAHRIREAMLDYGSAQVGGEGKTVECDKALSGIGGLTEPVMRRQKTRRLTRLLNRKR